MKKLILIGGGGHCKSVIDVLELEKVYDIRGILDVKEKVGTEIRGHRIIGTDDEIERLAGEGFHFLITLGQIKSGRLRSALFERLVKARAQIATVISPLAQKSESAIVGSGTVLMHHALVNAGARIGNNCIINTKSLIEHDAVIGDHCHVSTAAVVNGECAIENQCFVGSNSVLLNNVSLAANTIVGAGAVVTKSIIKAGVTVAGSPARIISQ